MGAAAHRYAQHCGSQPPNTVHKVMLRGLARITSRFDDLPELYTFECRPCGVSHIEVAFHDFSPREHNCPAIRN